MNCSPWGSSVHGISQTRILEWVAILFSRESSLPRDWTRVSCIPGRFFAGWATREAPAMFHLISCSLWFQHVGTGCHVFFPIPPSSRSGGEIPDKLPSRTLISHTLADDHWKFSHVAVTFSLCLSPLSMLSRNLKPGKKGLHLFSFFPIRRFSWVQGGLLHPVILLYGTQGLEGERKCWKMIILWLILHWDWLV